LCRSASRRLSRALKSSCPRSSCWGDRAKNPGNPFALPSRRWIRKRGVSPLSRNSNRSISSQLQQYVRQSPRALTPVRSRITPLMGMRIEVKITPTAPTAGAIASGRPTWIALTTTENPTNEKPTAQSQSSFRRQSLTRITVPSGGRIDVAVEVCPSIASIIHSSLARARATWRRSLDQARDPAHRVQPEEYDELAA